MEVGGQTVQSIKLRLMRTKLEFFDESQNRSEYTPIRVLYG